MFKHVPGTITEVQSVLNSTDRQLSAQTQLKQDKAETRDKKNTHVVHVPPVVAHYM